jgi:hypothetical protein
MELPTVLVFGGVYALGAHRAETVPLVFLAIWMLHYVHRTFIFPLRMNGPPEPMPLVIALMGFTFNTLNCYLVARWVSHLATYETSWLVGVPFLAGLAIFAAGFVINIHSDTILLRLAARNQGYVIPHGGMFRFVSCPNYLGELMEWTGYALLTMSPAAALFALYTSANLGPRARSNHRWYREKFPDYPPERKALVPFLL